MADRRPKLNCPYCKAKILLRGEWPYGKTIRIKCPKCHTRSQAEIPERTSIEELLDSVFKGTPTPRSDR